MTFSIYYQFTYGTPDDLIQDILIYDQSEIPNTIDHLELEKEGFLSFKNPSSTTLGDRVKIIIRSDLLELIVKTNDLVYGHQWLQQLIPYVRDYQLNKLLKK